MANQFNIQDFRRFRKPSSSKIVDPNSALSSSAQYPGLCESRTMRSVRKLMNSVLVHNSYNLTRYELAIIELQYLHGLRISECLQISHHDILLSGQLLLAGKKGSSNRVVTPVLFVDYFLDVRRKRKHIENIYNRFHFYRLYKKIGISQLATNEGNKSVTHYFRYMYISSLLAQSISIEIISELIGHKRVESTIHYVNKLEKK